MARPSARVAYTHGPLWPAFPIPISDCPRGVLRIAAEIYIMPLS